MVSRCDGHTSSTSYRTTGPPQVPSKDTPVTFTVCSSSVSETQWKKREERRKKGEGGGWRG